MATTIEPETKRDSGPKAAPTAVAKPAPTQPGGRRRVAFLLMGIALLTLVGLGVRRWIFSLSHESTDNAQVDGHIVPILPKVGGFVTEIPVDENQRVKEGDTLVVLDDRDYKVRLAQAEADLAVALASVSNRARVGQAEAQVEQAQANASKAHADLDRMRPLAAPDTVSCCSLTLSWAASGRNRSRAAWAFDAFACACSTCASAWPTRARLLTLASATARSASA